MAGKRLSRQGKGGKALHVAAQCHPARQAACPFASLAHVRATSGKKQQKTFDYQA
jgi:hypothetical protein